MPDAPEYRYFPSKPIAIALIAVAVIAAFEAIASDSTTGRLVLGCATVLLAAIGITDLVFTPRLQASSAGLTVFTPSVRARLRWSEIDSIRVDERNRRGLSTRALEIEANERLIVLSRRSLGRDAREVYAELLELRG